jgi:hypothetical protein
MEDHEYALLGGANRAKIGRYIGIGAGAISGAIVFCLLSLVDIAKNFHIPVNLPPSVLSLLGAGSVFAILYSIFEKYIWKWSKVKEFLKVPDLTGTWRCIGTSIDASTKAHTAWEGVVTITQTWDRLKVRLKTTQSGSNSITAALSYEQAVGFHLIYSYRNKQNIDQLDLRSHIGFSNMTVSEDQATAEGDYFNGHGRFTFGTMKWTRE